MAGKTGRVRNEKEAELLHLVATLIVEIVLREDEEQEKLERLQQEGGSQPEEGANSTGEPTARPKA